MSAEAVNRFTLEKFKQSNLSGHGQSEQRGSAEKLEHRKSGVVAVILGVILQITGNSAPNVASPTILRKFATVKRTLLVWKSL
jgi:hypothetical protein